MSENISVGIMFDTEYIVQNTGKGGSCDSPKQVVNQDKCIYMVSDYANEISGHGYSELNIRANRGDDIIWRATALDFGSGEYTPFLYEFVATAGSENMENIEVNSTSAAIAYPQTNHDNAPNCAMYLSQPDLGQVSAKVKYQSGVTYHIRFMLVEPTGPGKSDFKVIGYYHWDPFINWGT